MPFSVSSLDDLQVLALSDLTRLPGFSTWLRRGTGRALAFMAADLADSELQYLAWQARQYLADTADDDNLLRIGAIYGLAPKGATPATGTAAFSGQAGLTIPAGALLALPIDSSGTTILYATQADLTLAGSGAAGSGSVAVEATTGGSETNADTGAPLTMQVAIAGVLPTATVNGPGLAGGTDAEDVDTAYRARVLARIQQPPQGGSASDYWQWAKAVPQVTRAWVYPLNRGAGTVDVTFVCDARTNIIPLSGDITAVQAAIDAVRPVTADCAVFAPVADTINVTLAGLTALAGTTLTQARANAEAALASLFATTTPGGAPYGDGLGPGQTGGTLLLEQISAVVSEAAGVAGFDLAAPASDITSAHGHLAVLGTVTFT